MHWMLNVVVGPKHYPAAVLIRGVVDANGPGRVTKLFGITGTLNGKSASKASGLWFERRTMPISPRTIARSARIGVEYAGPVWSKKKWRFTLKNND